MSCHMIGCDVPNFYHYNPLRVPFHEFHGRVVECFGQMSERGKGKELALRVAIVVISPFAYLALGLMDLLGRISDPYWKNRHIEEIENKKAEAENSSGEVDKKTDAETEKEKIDPELEMKKFKAEMEKKKIEDELLKEVMKWLPCPWIIDALGGAEKVKNLPKLEEEVFYSFDMSHPVMIYFNKDNNPGLFFRVVEKIKDEESGELKEFPSVLAMGWNSHLSSWLGTNNKNPLLSNRDKVYNSTSEEFFIADRIQRLVNGKGIGLMEKLPGIPFVIPEDKTPYKPKEEDSHLKGKELDAYLQTTNAIYYEKVAIPGVREIVLE